MANFSVGDKVKYEDYEAEVCSIYPEPDVDPEYIIFYFDKDQKKHHVKAKESELEEVVEKWNSF